MSKTIEFQMMSVEKLHESPNNPRKRFDNDAIQELAQSIKSNGILTPILVRPNSEGFEIGAGHRRFRAAKLAELKEVPCIIRQMNDDQFLELLIIENDQREDVHPLEEADGYFALSRRPGYDVEKIASKIGRSIKYVYDRLKLLSLTKEAQRMFLDNKFTAGHAILLARLSPAQQKQAIDDALFEGEDINVAYDHEDLFTKEQREAMENCEKCCSVKELESYIEKYFRFDRSAPDPILFPETAQILTTAKEKADKVVPITLDHHIQQSGRAAERTIVPTSWKRADGQAGSKTCDHSVIGTVVIGTGRGKAFRVCIAKEKCKIHWGKWQEQREKRSKLDSPQKKKFDEKAKAKEEAANKEREERAERLKKAEPFVKKAVLEAIKKLPASATGYIADTLVESVFRRSYRTVNKNDLLPRGKTAEDLLRYLASFLFINELQWDGLASQDFKKRAKQVGLDLEKLIDQAVPPLVEKTIQEKKKAKKSKSKK